MGKETAIATLLLFLCAFLQLPAASPAIPATWKTYENPGLGFRFRYPESLELRDSAPVGGRPHVVDLMARDIDPQRAYLGHAYALRVAVWEHGDPMELPAIPVSYYEKQPNYKAITVGGRPAGQFQSCVSRSRICHWLIIVYGESRELNIFTMDPDESEKPLPDSSRYPFLQIIDSFVFSPTFPK